MSTSLKALRQDVGKDLGACITGTVDSGTTTNIVDAELLDADESDSLFTRNWVKVHLSAGAETRRVRVTDGYAPDTGTLAWGRAMSSTPAADEEYEIHTLMHPDDMDRLINEGLKRCFYIEQEEITVVNGQREYELSAITWLTRKRQVAKVLLIQGTTSLKQRHLPMWFWIEEDAGTLTLYVQPCNRASGETMLLIGTRAYSTLATDAATTDCPEDWARAAGRFEVLQWLVRGGPAKDVERYRVARDEAAQVFSGMCRRYAPRPTFVVRHPDVGLGIPDSSVVR